MRWIAGIDGGGSKTAVLLRTVDGKETRTCRVGSIDPAEYGVEGYAAGLLAALTQLGVTAERVAAVCIGIPCFGEYPELDAAVSARTRQLFPNGAVRCENDCYVGFAGAFGLKAGINVVAGTGAIAYGEDEEGHAARSGGWHHDFRMRAPAYGWGVSRLHCLPGRWTAAHPARRFMRSFGKDWDCGGIRM